MLAKAAPLPDGPGWLYDPKWDGFRSIVFRDGDEVVLGSRNEKPLTRYFPELVEWLRAALPDRVVLDGEIVCPVDGVLDFGALGQRIHPAESRVRMLAERTPATFIAFDLLALGDEDLRSRPLGERRVVLMNALVDAASRSDGHVVVTPATLDRSVAERWFTAFEAAGCDGIVAKRVDGPYVEDKRVMIKVKHARTADCVVAGFRWHKNGPMIGSILLGLYDDAGVLHHVGVCGAFPEKRRREMVEELAPYAIEPSDAAALAAHPWGGWAEAQQAAAESGQRLPGAQSRWTGGKDLSFVPLRPELVVEVSFDHMEGDRFRHAGQLVRWRPDREPSSCTYAQLEEAPPSTFADVLAAGG